ncbi:MAG: serpin family protein [Bacilli bacterium]|nr:serpin family protein [Bacilli bacterium]
MYNEKRSNITKILIIIMMLFLCISLCSCNALQNIINDMENNPIINNNDDNNHNDNNDASFVSSKKVGALNEVSYSFNEGCDYCNETLFNKLSFFSSNIFDLCVDYDNSDNYCISPLSIYMAFSILHYLGDDNVKRDVEEMLEMDSEDISDSGCVFLKMLNEKYFNGKLVSKLLLTNSIWLDSGLDANQIVLDELGEKYYCYAHNTPFSLDNKKANKEIREFIKEKTNGLIDKDFELSDRTIFAIINTLYFKDIWKDGAILDKAYRNFCDENGMNAVKKIFLYSNYIEGVVQKNDDYSFFYAETHSNYKIKFILPNEGVSIDKCMDSKTIDYVNKFSDYNNYDNNDSKDNNSKITQKTSCIFPAFEISSSTPLKEILEDNNYLPHAFASYNTPLIKGACFVSDIKHQVILNVNDEGIEGAAVTIITNEKSAHFEFNVEYNEFVINRPFIAIVTDTNNCILFIAKITNPESSINGSNLEFVKD